MHFDVIVIGAGAGGLTVAAFCAQLGQKVALIERGKMGGDCLNFGCVPSKALLHAAQSDMDFAAAMAHVKASIAAIEPNDSIERFTGLGVEVIQGEASFLDSKTLLVNERKVSARRIVIATGTRPAIPQLKGLENYLTNETVFELQELPSHLVVLGAGAIGVEMAQAFRGLGAQVTLIEKETLLAREDVDAAALIRTTLLEKGVQILEKTTVFEQRDKTLLTSAGEIDFSHLLVAIGRKPNIESLNLFKAGVTISRSLRTSHSHIYAVGDVNGIAAFTHAAGGQGSAVAQHILFRKPLPQAFLMPRVLFTNPELAHVGEVTEFCLRSDFIENDRSICEADTQGFLKLYHDKKGIIKGATLIGKDAGEQLSLYTLAISKGLKISDLAALTVPYPTRSEIGKRAAGLYYKDLAKKPIIRKIVSLLKILG